MSFPTLPRPVFRTRLRWLWLVYLIFFLMGPIQYGSTFHVLLALGGVVAFLPLYVVADRMSGLRVLWPMAGMIALGVAFAFKNPGASVFFVYAAAECGRLGDRRRALLGVIAVAALVVLTALVVQAHLFFWIPAVTLVAVIGTLGIHEREMERKNLEVARSREEVEQLARIAERERIARDLHDLLGHTLSVVILKSELARKLADRDPVRAAAEIREVELVARKALGEVRAAVSAYRAESFLGELDNARVALASAGVALEVENEEPSLPPLHEGVLALSLREAITNVIRHAQASSCRVLLRADGGLVRLLVEDNGAGARAHEGAGLTGMRERIASLGGRLEKSNDRGTRLLIELPLVAHLELDANEASVPSAPAPSAALPEVAP